MQIREEEGAEEEQQQQQALGTGNLFNPIPKKIVFHSESIPLHRPPWYAVSRATAI